MPDFAHLHMHSDFSLLDGMNKVEEIVTTVKSLGMSSVALTDHGNMMGAVQFYKSAQEHGVKPIFGVEGYIVKDRKDKTDRGNYHIILLAKDKTGYRNLMKVCSEAYVSGFHMKPRFDLRMLEEHREGLIATTACLKGIVTNPLYRGLTDEAVEILKYLMKVFKDDFYVEVMNHGIEAQLKVLPMLENLAEDYKIKVIATNDAHYAKPEDHEAHDVLLCIQTGSTIHDPNRMIYKTPEFYIKSPEQMAGIFPKEYLDNTMEISEKCNVELELKRALFPSFPVPKEPEYTQWLAKKEVPSSSFAYMKYLTVQSMKAKFKDNVFDYKKKPEYIERLRKELDILETKGLADYFLVVSDFVQWSKSQKIIVGPGRGSAAGSLVAYLLGITAVDPLKYGLLFERFINPHRKGFPDIDTDFQDSRRAEVIQYIIDKYGKDRTCQIGTISRLNAKVCIRDVARALGMSIEAQNAIAQKIPDSLGQKKPLLGEYRRTRPEVKELADQFPDLFRIAERIETCARHVGVHPAGLIISSEVISDVVPLHTVKGKGKDKERIVVSQFDMRDLEQFGLIKMDILGLTTLTVLQETLALIQERYGIELNLPV